MTWSRGREVLWPSPRGRKVLWPGPGGCCDLVPGGGCPPPPPRVGQTDACENITFARSAKRAVKMWGWDKIYLNASTWVRVLPLR